MLALISLAQAARLEGEVRERGTGDPLGGALITVDGETLIVAGARGTFLAELTPGDHELEVSAPDHEPLTLAVVVPLSEPLVVYLPESLPEAEIVVEARRSTPHVSAQVLDRERVEKVPGTFEDPVRLLQALPGVAQTPEYSPTAGSIAVRGASPQENRFYLDGVEIPYLFHFNQYSSVFHTRMLDELALYPSTYGAAYGDAVGGIVDARSRRPDTERVHGGLSWNLVMGGGWLTAPVGERGALSVSARRSYLDARQEGDTYTIWPRFWDYLARYDHELSDQHRISATAFGAGDAYGRYVGGDDAWDPLARDSRPELAYDRAFHAVVLRVEDELPGATLTTSLGLVQDDWTIELTDAEQIRQERYALLRHDGAWRFGAAGELGAGLEIKATRADLQVQTEQAWPLLEAEAPLLTSGREADEQLRRVLGGAYLEPRLQLGRVKVQPGVRVQADTDTGELVVDPRGGLRVPITDDVAFRAAAGRYSEAPPLDFTSQVHAASPTPLGKVRAATSHQAAAGVDWAVGGRWELGLDGWAKSFDGAWTLDDAGLATQVDGRAWGVELTSRYRIRERFFSWFSLVVGRAWRQDAPFDFDQPYALSLVGSWNFRPHWNAGVRYRVSAGLPFTPVEGGVYQGDTDTYAPILGDANSQRLPAYQKLDLHLERELEFQRWTLVLYGEAWYVPKRANAMYLVYSYDYSESAVVAGPSFLPLVGARAEF